MAETSERNTVTVFRAFSPIDGKTLGKYKASSPAEINKAMQAARLAAQTWAAVSVVDRSKILAQFNGILLADIDAICQTICLTTGKVSTEALLGEIYPILDLLRYYGKNAARILKSRGVVTSPFSYPGATAQVSWQPYGVVAIISPWNYPFLITVGQILSALYAGNAVIFKPSELSLPVGELIMSLFSKLNLPQGLVQWLVGDGLCGSQLIDSAPDLVVFTGSLNVGRAVMQRAAQHPIPVLLELGGKDAMIVCADAHLQRACDGALYGAFCNSGQACVAVERLYVEKSCFDAFLTMLLAGVGQLTVGHGEQGDLGAMTSTKQIEIVKNQYNDALSNGAKASGPLEHQGNYLKPVLLWNLRPNMLILQEETFGPLLPVMPFKDEEEAIQLANSLDFGLNASVWSQDIAKAERIAKRLTVGNWSVNDVLKNAGHAGLPFGGVKKSGFGRCHGAAGLRNFAYPVSGLTSRSHLAKEPNWFPYSQTNYGQFKGFVDFVYGEGNFISRGRRNLKALQAFREYSTFNLKQGLQNLKLMLPWHREF